jgi:hypothetical protein
MSALMVGATVVPVTAADDNGKGFAEGAFHNAGAGGYNVAVGTAAQATPIPIPAGVQQDGVRIFGYEGGPSDGNTYCGDVWNVIVTATILFPDDKWLFDGLFTTHYVDGEIVGATSETAVRANQGFLGEGERGWSQVFGTFLPPGTLDDGQHTIMQVLEHDPIGVFWAPPPATIFVNDSAC